MNKCYVKYTIIPKYDKWNIKVLLVMTNSLRDFNKHFENTGNLFRKYVIFKV